MEHQESYLKTVFHNRCARIVRAEGLDMRSRQVGFNLRPPPGLMISSPNLPGRQPAPGSPGVA
jgi:hypothetical protein